MSISDGISLALLVCLANVCLAMAYKYECELRKVGPLRVTMAANRALCYSLCSTESGCKVILYKEYAHYEADEASGGNRYTGNCVLMNKHENNLLSERLDDGYKMCRTYDVLDANKDELVVPPFTCLAQTSYNVTRAAHEAGFTVEVKEPGLGITRCLYCINTIIHILLYQDLQKD